MRRFNLRLFMMASIADACLLFISFYGGFSTLFSGGFLFKLSGIGVAVFGFPLITILEMLDVEVNSSVWFYIILLLNGLVVGLLAERIISLIKRRVSSKS